MDRLKISSDFKWNLDNILNGKKAKFYFAEIEKISDIICSYQGKIANSYNDLFTFIKEYEKLEYYQETISCYLYNKQSEDTTNSQNTSKLLEFSNFIQKINLKFYWITNEVLDKEKKIKKLLIKDLSNYQDYFFKVFRTKKHRISNEKEEVVCELSNIFSSYSVIFSQITSSDFVFGTITDSNDKKYTLTQGNYSNLFTNDDKTLRKNAYLTFWNKYYEFKNTLSINYYYNVLTSEKIAKIYKYKDALESNLYADNLTEKFYDTLLSSCKANNHLIKRWKQLCFKILQNNNPTPWDASRPLFKMSNKKFEITDSKNIIKKALSPLGNDYLAKVNYIFNSNCIDYMPNKGKRQGAYSYGIWNNNPYICMNWNGKYLDLSTLIHELGHSVHTLYSNENQPYQYHNYPIFLAEIASITNEVLLVNHLYNNTMDNEFKKVVLEKVIGEFIATVFRQLQFAEYEKWTHNQVKNNLPLDISVIETKCRALNASYFPKFISQKYCDQYEGLWGIYVPHFYRDFYVFQYAVGMICALIIANKIEEDQEYYKKYLYFLSSGNKHFPLDILKEIDIDLEDEKTIQQAYNRLEKFIELLEIEVSN